MTTPPPESTPALVAPTVEETRAISNAFSEEEIRNLAQLIAKSGALGFDPTTIVKGVVTAVDFAGSPPTVSIQISGESTVTINSVSLLNNYSPQAGHTVLIAKQGANIVVLGHIADVGGLSAGDASDDWQLATLSVGTHGANNNGDICFRRVMDHGSWKMQWRGGWAPPASGEFMIDAGQALPEEYRPTGLRSVLAARQFSTGAMACQVDFTSDGRVRVTGMTGATSSASSGGDVLPGGGGDYVEASRDRLRRRAIGGRRPRWRAALAVQNAGTSGKFLSKKVAPPTREDVDAYSELREDALRFGRSFTRHVLVVPLHVAIGFPDRLPGSPRHESRPCSIGRA